MIKKTIILLALIILCNTHVTQSTDTPWTSIIQLQDVPLLDNTCILDTKILPISTTNYWLYNPSILKHNNTYLITLRHDTPSGASKIGYQLYDKTFQPISPLHYYSTQYIHPEDARLFTYNNTPHIVYACLNFVGIDTAPLQEQPFKELPWRHCTGARQTYAHIDATGTIEKETLLPYTTHTHARIYSEKNWVPFEYISESGIHTLYYIYAMHPLTIVSLDSAGTIHEECTTTTEAATDKLETWTKKWGKLSGGTPALLIGNEYYTFFHSFFIVDKKRFYVFGALTFENKPPFRITRISKYPILHAQFYTYTRHGTSVCGSGGASHVLFPGGFVHETNNNEDIFHILCGENDQAVRLITVKKSELLKHMDVCF